MVVVVVEVDVVGEVFEVDVDVGVDVVEEIVEEETGNIVVVSILVVDDHAAEMLVLQ